LKGENYEKLFAVAISDNISLYYLFAFQFNYEKN
jgi:hypothetical protein